MTVMELQEGGGALSEPVFHKQTAFIYLFYLFKKKKKI